MDSSIGEQIAQVEQEKEFVRRILIADDSSVARKQVQRAIESIGFEVVTTKDGKDAYEKLLEMLSEGPISNQISLVISDIEMPEMDGYTLTAEIRRHNELKNLMLFCTLH